ncbi:MAG: SDR family oxidoreductase [Sphingomonadaceae bacterium]|nr:SDR family oxidoreductase [Sphingomonadaceae bacterium]
MTEPLGSMRRFAGKAVAITGAASGIGAAAAARFAAEGARLALCDLNADRLNESSAALGLAEADLFVRAVDVSDGAAVEAFVADAAAALGGLDVLVNNAGIGCFGHVDEITPEQWRRTLAVDLDAVFFGSRAALPYLRESQGCIVNTASISGAFGDPGLVAYNVAKAGVINLTRNMAVDHADDGIRVNCICPGGAATTMIKAHTRDEPIMAEYERLVPMGRLGTPEEMAAGIAFLASADASYITGHALTIDGGVTAQTGQPNFDRIYRERGWDKKMLARKPEPEGR